MMRTYRTNSPEAALVNTLHSHWHSQPITIGSVGGVGTD